MKKLILLLNIILCFSSCESNMRREFYENGKIKKEYSYKNSKLEGYYKEYYESGNLKEKSTFYNNQKRDSIIYYYDTIIGSIKKIDYIEKSDIRYSKSFFINGKLSEEKFFDVDKPIFKLKKYDPLNDESEIQEFYMYNNRWKLNQNWYLKDGDTIFGLGANNYDIKKIISKDKYDEYFVLLSFFKRDLFFKSLNSEVYICYTFNYDLKNDFKNLDEQELDTLYNDWRNKNKNHDSNNLKFQVDMWFLKKDFEKVKSITGYLVEKNYDIDKDSFDFQTNNIYFDINLNE